MPAFQALGLIYQTLQNNLSLKWMMMQIVLRKEIYQRKGEYKLKNGHVGRGGMLCGLHQVNPLPKLSLIYMLKWQPQTKGKRGTLPTQSLLLQGLCTCLWAPGCREEELLPAHHLGERHWCTSQQPEKEELLSWMPGSYQEEFSEWWHLLHTRQAWPQAQPCS